LLKSYIIPNAFTQSVFPASAHLKIKETHLKADFDKKKTFQIRKTLSQMFVTKFDGSFKAECSKTFTRVIYEC